MDQVVCPWCDTVFSKEFLYCPHCGVKVEGNGGISWGKQLSVYSLSVFLPPLGIFPGFKYLFNKHAQVKRVGIIAIILTIVATVVTIWMTMGLVNSINSQLNTQLDQYQYLEQ